MKKLLSALLMVAMLMSFVCFSASADEGTLYIDENFSSMEALMQNFFAGAFYVEDNLLFGYSEALVFCTAYEDGEGIFENHPTCWLTYDCQMTFIVGEDEFYTGENRGVQISYCNDNPFYEGRADGRHFMNFNYDIINQEFTLNVDYDGENPIEPVPMELPVDSGESITLGMSVSKGRIRCFYEDQLIFDFVDTNNEYLIGHVIESPFLIWNFGNFIQIQNVKIASDGYLFPFDNAEDTTAPVTQAPAGDDTQAPAGDDTQAPAGDDTQAPAGDDTQAPAGDDTNAPAGDDTNAPAADGTDAPAGDVADTVGTTGTQRPSTSTGDASFVVVAAMIAALGSALIVRKVRG